MTSRVSNMNNGQKTDNVKLLKFLVQKKASKKAIEDKVAQLVSEGWNIHPNLPDGWLVRRNNSESYYGRQIDMDTTSHYLVYKPFFGRFNSKQAAVTALKRHGESKKFLAKFIVIDSDFSYKLDTEQDSNWQETDQNLPLGWKSRSVCGSRELLSSEGVCYPNLVSALQHIAHPLSRDVYTRQEVEKVRSLLGQEGWSDHTMLPEGWKINRTGTVSMFLTKEGRMLQTYEEALKTLNDPKNKYTAQDVTNFVEAGPSLRFNSQGEEKSDCMLPSGWSLDTLPGKMVRISGPGVVFFSRIKAIEFMIENDVEPDYILGLWNGLGDEDWRFGENFVPVGWGVRRCGVEQFMFLTREIEVLANVEQALDYIENEEAYTGEDYKKMKKWSDILKGNKWVTDSELPDGWKKSEEEEEEASFLAPSGNILTDRVSLIQFLIKEGTPPEEIIKAWNTLELEGWMRDDKNLPLGWKSRYDLELDEYHYLSPLMQVVTSESDLCSLITDPHLVSEDERTMVEHLKKWQASNQ